MLEVLHKVEEMMPSLLSQEEAWHTLYIDYHPPIVERLFQDIFVNEQKYRVFLHRIHPCAPGEDLFHPHPWESAMRILRGRYEMEIGFGAGQTTPPVLGKVILSTGDEYELTHPDAWHRVRPLERPVYSLMVAGTRWNRWSPKSEEKLRHLSLQEYQYLRSIASDYYLLERPQQMAEEAARAEAFKGAAERIFPRS
jgi:hypothetical protein